MENAINMNQTPETRSRVRLAGLLAGPVLAAICLVLLPREYQNEEGQEVAFTLAGRLTLAVMVWMAVWWLTEAIKISGTALLPLFLFPVLGVAQMKEAAAPYANPLIFLFMGGFLLGLSMQRWGLDRRIALRTLRMVGTRPRNMVGGFMLSTAILSAFVSNTATAAMMLPIAVSVKGNQARLFTQRRERRDSLIRPKKTMRQLGDATHGDESEKIR